MKTEINRRKISVFELLLLVIGVTVIISGSIAFNILIASGYGVYELVSFVALWLVVVFLVVICAISENSREDLGIIVKENSREIKLLRDISKEHLEEIRIAKASPLKKKK